MSKRKARDPKATPSDAWPRRPASAELVGLVEGRKIVDDDEAFQAYLDEVARTLFSGGGADDAGTPKRVQ
ncbi:MAG: hypothetical protein FIA92_07680 [Chloroflexi bacterium]|nr:hypothetical protein [Chloroflexota bacterium]